jgi:hypothetical protein
MAMTTKKKNNNRTVEDVSRRKVEVLLKEVSEQSRNYEKALAKLLRQKPGSDGYDGDLGKVWAEAEVLATKAEHAKMAIDEYTESLGD